ncbi:hypothetical protein V1515DRAFT_579762 [Lipomyces mesembrius]
MYSDKNIIVVIGATGNQGSSVAHTFLHLPNWHVRCVSRNPSSPNSQALAALGAEVVQGDLSDPASLSQAFESANAIFVNTDFWTLYRGEGKASEEAFDQEVTYGRNAAVAAATVPSLRRLVYSALPPMKKHSKGKYSQSYHCDTKAAIVEYIATEQPALARKHPISIWARIIRIREDRLPIIDAKVSTGLFVRALVEDEAADTKLLAYDSCLSVREMVDLWSAASRQEASLVEASADFMHRQLGITLEVLDSPCFISEFGYVGGVDGAIEPFQLKRKIKTKPFEE